MKPNKLYQDLSRALGSGLLCTGMLLAASGSHAVSQNEIAQVPPSVAEGVPPNMIFTLDDSGSMAWAYVPDVSSSTTSVYYNKIQNNNSRRMRAANTNPMAYNPHIIYNIPRTFDQNGSEIILSTEFTNAPINGFWIPSERGNNGAGKKNLSTNYRLPYSHTKGTSDTDGTVSWANNPTPDFGDIKRTLPASNGTYIFEPDEAHGIKVEITRTNDGCSAKAFMGSIVKTPSCSRSGNTATVKINSTTSEVPAYYYEYRPNFMRTDTEGKSTVTRRCDDYEDTSGKGKHAFKQNEHCYQIVWVDENSAYDENRTPLKHPNGQVVDGRQNFANWYSFYRTRALATLSGAKIAFYNLSPDVRLTWKDLNTCRNLTTQPTACGQNQLKPYSSKHRGEFYTWMRKHKFNSGTPLIEAMRLAGEFLKRDEPWEKTPFAKTGNNPSNTYACRPSYHVMMTDGLWNGSYSTPGSFIKDQNDFSTPVGEKYGSKSYGKRAPYYDKNNNTTLADMALHYWATDLKDNLDNRVRPYIPYKNDDENKEYWDPRNNPAEWQSMSNFIMALGLTTILGSGDNAALPWGGNTHGGVGYQAFLNGTQWPVPSNNSPNNVYDLWHAAINSRGEFYSVDSPDAMVQAFQDILTRIAERKSSAAMPGTSSSTEVFEDEDGDEDERLNQFFFQTSFNTADGWSGELIKTKKYREYNHAEGKYEWITVDEWRASEEVPSPANRKIYMANSTGKSLIEFTAGNMTSSALYGGENLSQHLAVNPELGKQANYSAAQRLEYLRGSEANTGDDDSKMRPRSSKLGDFLGSEPVVVGNQGRYLEGFANKLEVEGAYTDFLTSIKDRKSVVYVGGNDGMLHAFNSSDGKEIFAFVPTPVFPYLNKLTGKNYSHQYYVDGTPTVADVFDGTKWRTILVGTLRAGGKGLFALDITDPDNISLLWEFHEYSSQVNGLAVKPGYSFSKPTVARLHNGQWGVVTGNGYKGTGTDGGKAALYVINAISGELVESMEVQARNQNGTPVIGENGLSTPRLADFDSDGVADYAYAGDLQGNLWRFDLLGGSASGPSTTPPSNGSYGTKNDGTSKFAVSYNGKPMFTAVASSGETQPITSAPSLVRHPTRLGYLVVFGTGRYVEIGDKEPNKSYAQSLYGIWDTKTKGEGTNNPPRITRGVTGNMTEQTFNNTDTTGKGEISGIVRNARTISNKPVEWYTDYNSTKPIKKRGWYLDFNGGGNQGEIMVEDMRTLGNTLFLQTLIPNDDPCANGAGNWLYAINPFTGGKTLHHAFDTRGTGDVIISGIQFGSEGGVSLGQDEEGYKAFAPGDMEAITPDPSSLGRQSWRMIQNP